MSKIAGRNFEVVKTDGEIDQKHFAPGLTLDGLKPLNHLVTKQALSAFAGKLRIAQTAGT